VGLMSENGGLWVLGQGTGGKTSLTTRAHVSVEMETSMPSCPEDGRRADVTCLLHAMMYDCETFQVASVPGPGRVGEAGLV